jgi:hypothetical protein
MRVLLGAVMLLVACSSAFANWYVLRLPGSGGVCKAAEMQPGAILDGELLVRQPSQAAAMAMIAELQGKGVCARSPAPSDANPPPAPAANK